jgi:hypothetical protein
VKILMATGHTGGTEMKWSDLKWYDKLGEIVAAAAVLLLPILFLFIAEVFNVL